MANEKMELYRKYRPETLEDMVGEVIFMVTDSGNKDD